MSAEQKRERLVVPIGRSWFDAVGRYADSEHTSRAEVARQAIIRDLRNKGFAPASRDEA
jgi:hypothetical protein